MNVQGTVHKYGDHVDTDVIIPARYLNSPDPKEYSVHCMEDIDDGFAAAVKCGDYIVAGENFGCGSSREHAPAVIKACGVSAVIAKSFARIFYRNAINIGLPIVECADAANDARNGDVISVDTERGTVNNETLGKTYSFPPYPAEIAQIIKRGGRRHRNND